MSYGMVRRLSESARSSVVDVARIHPRPLRLTDLEPGWAVVDLTGHRVGRVTAVTDRGLVVRRGLLRGETTVPFDRIGELHHGEVRLTVARGALA